MNERLSDLITRTALASDADALAVIIREAALSEKIRAVPLDQLVLRVKNLIQLNLKNNNFDIFVVTDSRENILAYAVIQWHIALFLPGGEGYISELTVRSASRGAGVGSILLNKLVEEGKKRDCTRMSLINSRFRDSYKRLFYNKRGWHERKAAASFIYEFCGP